MATQTNAIARDRGPAADAAGPAVVVRALDLAKAFGATQALRRCSFELRRGEVHAIMGENGSGKSTLVKILSGVHRPDAGRLELHGTGVPGLRSPRAALGAGIATVFQEVLVVGPRPVLDNVWLGTDGLWRHRRSRQEKAEQATAILAELIGSAPDLDAPVEELSLSDRQACCIARALVRRPGVLILDEATSALDVDCRRRLFDLVRQRTAEGTAVVFISHRMDEVEEIADRVTVMRSGETVATVDRDAISVDEIVRLVTGAEALVGSARERHDRRIGPVVLRTRDLRLRPGGRPIDLEVRAGELVGLAGLEGHGQDDFLRVLWGRPAAAGEVTAETDAGSRVLRDSEEAAALGVAYVPRERRAEALFEALPVWQNFALPTASRDRRSGLLSSRLAQRRMREYVELLHIRLGHPADAITTLSGGNQQKVVLARWLAAEPRILLLNDPTRGVDLGAKRDIYELLSALAAQGIAVVMLSTEVDEHVELMDRVLVFREHELAAEVSRERLSRHTLVASFFGEEGGHDDA